MRRALCGILCVLVLAGATGWGQVGVMVGPGALSLVDETFAGVDWRLAADVHFWQSLGARLWLRVDRDFGLGFGLGPTMHLGQVSFLVGIMSLPDGIMWVGGMGIEFGLGRAGPVHFQFFNDLEFALSLAGEENLRSFIQYHVGLTIAF